MGENKQSFLCYCAFLVKPVFGTATPRGFLNSMCCALYHADKLLAPPAADSDGESDGSDRVPVPNFQNSFSQALGKALMQLDSGPVSSQQPVVEPGQEPLIPHIYLAEAWYFWLDSLFVQRRSHAHSRLGFFSFRWKRRKKEEEKAEASIQHIHGSHKVDNTEVHLIILFLPHCLCFQFHADLSGTISYGKGFEFMLLQTLFHWLHHLFELFVFPSV